MKELSHANEVVIAKIYDLDESTVRDLWLEFVALTHAASPQSGEKGDEPVAWRVPNMSGSGDEWAYRDADDRFEDSQGNLVGEPLYARAAAPQAALTDEQIAHIAAAHTNSVVEFDRLLKFARAILKQGG